MKNKTDIDQIIQEGMANFEPMPPADAWSFIENQIQVAPAPVSQGNQLFQAIQQVSLVGKIIAVAGVSLVSVGLYFGLTQKQGEQLDLPKEEKIVQAEVIPQKESANPAANIKSETKVETSIKTKLNNKKETKVATFEKLQTSSTQNSNLSVNHSNSSDDKVLVQAESLKKTNKEDSDNKKKEEDFVVEKINRKLPNNGKSNAPASKDFELSLSNAFSPDGDGKNDTWEVQIDHAVFYHVIIIDANTEVIVFESSILRNDWNGKNMKTGVDCVIGKYAYIIDYQISEGSEKKTKRGIIQLFR